MTKHQSPRDPAFNKALLAEVEGTKFSERVVFYDTENKPREAIYPREFHTGVLQKVRKRLEDEGVLKAVVHVSAAVLGSPTGHGPRTTVVEYIPNGTYYGLQYQPPRAFPVDLDAEVLERTQHLFDEREETEEDN